MTCSSLPSQVTKLLGRFAKVRQITCLGEAMIELSFDDAMSRTATVGVAGDVLNTAYYLRLFADPGVEVRFSTALGNDPYSKRVLKFAEESNLLTDATVTRVDKNGRSLRDLDRPVGRAKFHLLARGFRSPYDDG